MSCAINFFMKKYFDKWNERKKEVDSSEINLDNFPQEGEVWMSTVGINIGVEQNGNEDDFSRPMLIVKKFNNQMFWAIILSSKQKDLDFYFNYTDPSGKKVSVVLAQMKLVSIKRLKRIMYVMDNEVFYEIKEKLKSFL